VVFLGNDPWSALSLAGLMGPADDLVRPTLVITRVPRPAGRGAKLRPTAVADVARRLGLPLIEVETVREGIGFEAMANADADVIAVVAYGEILPRNVLSLPRLGCVNLHFSLLPRWRGASPVQHAILEGDAETGVTTMLMDEGLDTGPILEQMREPVAPSDDAGSLGAKLATMGGAVLASTILALDSGEVRPEPQPREGTTHAPKLTRQDRVLDWTQDAAAIGRRVRALAPAPGATTSFRGEVLKVARGEPVPGIGEPAVILPTEPAIPAVDVGTRDGIYRLLEVAPSGRKRMPAVEWARGARFEPGERLG
jgi:methionyl-tRNA formyltransferase